MIKNDNYSQKQKYFYEELDKHKRQIKEERGQIRSVLDSINQSIEVQKVENDKFKKSVNDLIAIKKEEKQQH